MTDVKTNHKDAWRYAALSLGITVLSNQFAYRMGRIIRRGYFHWNFTLPVDNEIPFVSWTVSIYWGCFIFWAAVYLLIARQEKEKNARFFCANMIANSVCFLFFIFLPTTNVRPVFSVVTIWDKMMMLLYMIDAPDNLFPSIHCMVSWFCWIGIRGKKEYPPALRCFTLALAVAVCISTLTTRQHVIVDVAGGIIVSELCYWASSREAVLHRYCRMVNFCMIFFKGGAVFPFDSERSTHGNVC